jgi:hypothetical protein
LVEKVVTDKEKDPPLVLAATYSFNLMVAPALLAMPHETPLPNLISEEDTKYRADVGEKLLVKIPFYPTPDELDNQVIRLFVGKDLLTIFREWIVAGDIPHAAIVEYIQSIGDPCFQDPRCLLTSFYQDRCTASLVTSLISNTYLPTKLLGEIIKEEKGFMGKDLSALEEYLNQKNFFYPAIHFAHRHHYGLSLVLLLVLSSVSNPQQPADKHVQAVAREFVLRCHETMRHRISKFFRALFSRGSSQRDLLLFPLPM